MFLNNFVGTYDVSLWEQLFRVFLAAILGAVFGLEREMKNKPAGFITFMLVSMGSCLFALLQINIINIEGELKTDSTRIIAQVVSGIGFLGAGTIIHNKGTVKGITTAALLWVSAAIGLLVGIGGINNYVIAICATIFFFPLSLVSRHASRKFVERHKVKRTFIIFEEQYEKELYEFFASKGAVIKKTFFHNKHIKDDVHFKEIYLYFSLAKKIDFNEFIGEILALPWVCEIGES